MTEGRENKEEYRYVALDPEEKNIKTSAWFLRGHNE
jgi:hypothetical protein